MGSGVREVGGAGEGQGRRQQRRGPVPSRVERPLTRTPASQLALARASTLRGAERRRGKAVGTKDPRRRLAACEHGAGRTEAPEDARAEGRGSALPAFVARRSESAACSLAAAGLRGEGRGPRAEGGRGGCAARAAGAR